MLQVAKVSGRSVSRALLALLLVISLTAACALNRASSKLSYVGAPAIASFPKRVGVATLVGNLTAQEEATDHLCRGLVDLGLQVVARNWDIDKVLRRSTEGLSETMPESLRKRLEETYGLQGIFVGTLSQERVPLINEVRLTLRLISIPDGKLLWSANVLGRGVTRFSGVKEMAVGAVEKALESLKNDLYPDPGGSSLASSKPGMKKSGSEKSD